MKKNTIQLDGKEYPIRQTNGAALLFKEQTGKEITEISQEALTEWFTYLWCCVKSACRAEGVEFGYSLMDFADRTSPGMIAQWAAQIGADVTEAEDGGEKKSR